MKLILTAILLMATFFSSVVGANEARGFDVGTHYQVIRDKGSLTPQLTEHFSLYCVHCFYSEGLFKQLKSTINSDAIFKRSHVLFLPQSKPKWANNMSFAFATARVLNVEDQFVAAIFDFHFNNKMMLGEIEDIRDVFSMLGIAKKTFNQTISSPQVQALVKLMAESARDDQVRFTPDLIVNNKYRVLLSSVRENSDPQQELTRLVKYLLTNP